MLNQKWDKKYLLLLVAVICLLLFFYGSQISPDNYFKHLPTIGGLAFALNTIINLAK